MNEAQKIQAIVEIIRTGTGAQDAKRDLEGVQSAAGGLNEHLKTLGATMAGVFTAREVARFAGEAVKAFADSERGLNLLNNTLRASGQFSEAYVLQLRNVAEALAEVTTADDDAIIAAERTMLSFGAQRKDMERLTKSALDLSVGLGVDLQTAASQLGRAVAGETMSFNRLGFEIDENADAATRLDQVLTQVQSRFGGLAQGEMKGLSGATSELKKAWDELKEAIGGVLGPTAAGAMRDLTTSVNRARAALAPEPQVAERQQLEEALRAGNARGEISNSSYRIQLQQLEEAFAARRTENLRMQGPGLGQINTSVQVADESIRAAALQRTREDLERSLQRLDEAKAAAAQLEFDQNLPQQGLGYNATVGEIEKQRAANAPSLAREAQRGEQEARRQAAREAADELKALEQNLTLESIRAGDSRILKVSEEYERRVATYRRLAEEHKISEQEMTALTRDAAFDRDRAVEESLVKQREAEKQAHEERLQEWRQVTAQIEQTIATNVAGGLVNAFRTGKFEADKFFSDLFAQIAQLILQTLILRAIRGMFGAAFAEGGTTFAAAGLPPTFAAEGLTQLNHATYFPKFNVVAGEAGMEMMTVLAKPRPMAFGGVQAMTGFAQGRELAVMPASGAAALASGGGSTGRVVIDVNLASGLTAEITRNAVDGAEVRITQQLGRDSAVRAAARAASQ